jgi:hypothetical protein
MWSTLVTSAISLQRQTPTMIPRGFWEETIIDTFGRHVEPLIARRLQEYTGIVHDPKKERIP